MTDKKLAIFKTFEEARDWAGQNIKGYPAWRVIPYEQGTFVIEEKPGGNYFYEDGTLQYVEPYNTWRTENERDCS